MKLHKYKETMQKSDEAHVGGDYNLWQRVHFNWESQNL